MRMQKDNHFVEIRPRGSQRQYTLEKRKILADDMSCASVEQADAINAARARGGRIVCVGTTSVRTLETVATEDGIVHAGSGFTQIFITPGVKIKAVDALITNFHLPQSTLLMLISALMGRENALEVYKLAVQEKYRFFSFGDAMLIE